MKHEIKIGGGYFIIEVNETPAEIIFKLTCLKMMRVSVENIRAFDALYSKVMGKYEGDPRPFVIVNEMTGERSVVHGDETDCMVVQEPTDRSIN